MTVHWLLLGAVAILVSSVRAMDCFSDRDNCVRELRALMASDDAFWFGQDYYTRCIVDGKPLPTNQCINPSAGLSVLQRFLNITSEVPAGITDTLDIVDVVFETPEGEYFGCDRNNYVPPVYQHSINPLEITEISSWSLDFTPRLTWEPKDQSTYYTIIAWDVGFFYLHGFYINAQGGNTDNAMTVVPYHGPQNPRLTANLFLFVIMEQAAYADPTTVGINVGSIIGANNFMFIPTQLLAAMPNTWTVPVAVNLMSKRGDAYSIEWQKNMYVVNNCPMLLSQEDAIRTVLDQADIPVDWSDEMGIKTGPLYAEKKAFIHSLSVELTVEYDSKETTIESCCVKTTYTDAMYRVSPFRGGFPAVTRDAPRIHMTPVMYMEWGQRPSDKHFTLMMVDMTDAAYSRDEKIFNIHWLVTDIKNADVSTGNEWLSYAGPNPFDRYTPRVYVFLLFEQSEPTMDTFRLVGYVSDMCPDFLSKRCGGQISEMVKDFDLKLAGVNWFGVEQDAYARKMIYERFIVQPMVNVCDGLPGFEDPCPKYEICDANSSHLVRASGLGVTLLVAVSAILKLFSF